MTSAELEVLRLHRLRLDLTYRALSALIGIPLSALHDLLNRPNHVATDRSAFKVREYLAKIGDKEPVHA